MILCAFVLFLNTEYLVFYCIVGVFVWVRVLAILVVDPIQALHLTTSSHTLCLHWCPLLLDIYLVFIYKYTELGYKIKSILSLCSHLFNENYNKSLEISFKCFLENVCILNHIYFTYCKYDISSWSCLFVCFQ